MTEGHATWVYAVTSGSDSHRAEYLAGVTGIAGEPLRMVNEAGLAAVVSSVDAAFVTEGALERHLRDVGELEAMARAHHAVVVRVAAQNQALPFRLATVYRDDNRVRGLLSDHRAELADTLRWLNGRTECGVKVWARDADTRQNRDDAILPAQGVGPGWGRNDRPGPGRNDCPGPGRNDGPGSGPNNGSGTAYLLQRRASMKARDDRWQLAITGGEQIHAALAARAIAAHRHAPQDAQLADDDGLMVLNGAYLLEADGIAEFEAAARAIVAGLDSFRLDVTGPWPPYSFAGGTHS